MRHYIGTESECLAVDLIISTNCGWPIGSTQRWAIPRETTTAGVYSIEVPEGSHGFSFEQMNEGVTLPISENVQFPIVGESE